MDRETNFENWIDEIYEAANFFDDELCDSEYYELAHDVFTAIEKASMMLKM